MDLDKAVELSPGVYWVGTPRNLNNLHCNAYLIIDHGKGVLIDPGPASDYKAVACKVRSLIPIEELEYIVLLHQDPDVAGSTTYFEINGFRGEIATHWRTSVITAYYGISSPYYLVNTQNYELLFGESRRVSFIPAPYLHFPGAIMAYDHQSRCLFSGDVFGALNPQWTLFAGPNYREKMIPYHQQYMPGNEILRPVMDILLKQDISMICPQHGSIICKDITDHITTLRNLECGLLLNPVHSSLQAELGQQHMAERVLLRILSFAGAEQVTEWFADSPFKIDAQNARIIEYQGQLDSLWNEFFDRIYNGGGSRMIGLLEPMVEQLQQEYGLTKPRIFMSALVQEKQRSAKLQKEKAALEAVNASLQNSLALTQEEMTKDQVTGLYNEDFFVRYLLNIFNEDRWTRFYALFIQIDNMREINETQGDYEGDGIIQQVGSILFYEKTEGDYLFRIDGPVFVMVCAESDPQKVLKKAELLRSSVEEDRRFFTQITISLGLLPVNHDLLGALSAADAMEYVFTIGRRMLRSAQRSGGNRVVEDVRATEREGSEGRAVIIEYDYFHAQLISEALEGLSIKTKICMSGPEAIDTILNFHPDVIISELFLLETDAFSLREELLEHTRTKDIPFVLISHQKNETVVARAINLGILNYLKKPYMLPELLGIVDSYVTKALQHGS